MKKMTRTDAMKLMGSLTKMGNVAGTVDVTFDSVADTAAKLDALKENLPEKAQKNCHISSLYQAILDGINDYETEHGSKPDAGIVAAAFNQAQGMIMDSAENMERSPGCFNPLSPIVAIRSMIATAIPFAQMISAEGKGTEGSIVIVSHLAGSDTGAYKQGDSLDGVSGGKTFISPVRTHKLKDDGTHTNFTGKITGVQLNFNECDQDAKVQRLCENKTKILVNGLCAVETRGNGDDETGAASIELKGTKHTVTATINIKTGVAKVTFSPAAPENTVVSVRAVIDVEDTNNTSPSLKIDGKPSKFKANSYRVRISATKEAQEQFANEIGVDVTLEGVMAARQQLQSETLYSLLNDLRQVGISQNSDSFDFAWDTQGQNKSQAEIAQELLGKIEVLSKKMAVKNGSHGVSHIYVGERIAAILSSLPATLFSPSGITARGSTYRLGQLVGSNIEVYYTPTGLGSEDRSEQMLLIGANATNPAFNPVIIGEVTPPTVEGFGPSDENLVSGYWVRGTRFVEQNPIAKYASSAAVINCLNMAY